MAVLNQETLQYDSVRDAIVTKFNTEGPSDTRFSSFKAEHIDQAIIQFTKRSKEKNAGDSPEWHRYRAESAVWSCNWPEQKGDFPGIEPLRMIEDACQDLPLSPQSIRTSEKEACSSQSKSASESEIESSTPEPKSEVHSVRLPTSDSEHKEMKRVKGGLKYAKLEDSSKPQIAGSRWYRIGWMGLMLSVLLVVLVAAYAHHFGLNV